jgi:tetratricopeptide (TPR) repeat protein
MNKLYMLSVVSLLLLVSACASGPKQTGPDISPEELIQLGQEAADRNRYNLALQYYHKILELFPDNTAMVCTAEYEIAFAQYKQKKFGSAKTGFNALLNRYDAFGGEQLPPKYKRLAVIVLKRIEDKEIQRQRLTDFFKNPFGIKKTASAG